MTIRIVASKLTCIRGGRSIFAPVDFTMSGGEFLTLAGVNGSGKSSLLRLIGGLIEPAAGTLTVGDVPMEERASLCHYFGHADALSDHMTVQENLVFWQKFFPEPALEISAALDRVQLSPLADVPAAVLSAGQRRRLTFARLLVTERPIWLLDEPTTALDAASATALLAAMDHHRATGGLVIAAVHNWSGPPPDQTLTLEPVWLGLNHSDGADL